MDIKYMPQDVKNPFTPSEKLLPPYADIPAEFKNFNNQNKWLKLFNDMFFRGLKSLEVAPQDGIDKDIALRHIRIAMQGWDSKHEHKEAGVAYLMSLWFKDVKWEACDARL